MRKEREERGKGSLHQERREGRNRKEKVCTKIGNEEGRLRR